MDQGGGGGGGGSRGTRDDFERADSHPTGNPAGNGGAAIMPCEALTFTTILLSPNPILIAGLPPGQWLNVERRPVDEEDTAIVVAPQPQAGESVVGSLGSRHVVRLLECLRDGEEFRARILAASTTEPCNVQVCHASRLPL